MSRLIEHGSTNQRVRLRILDSDGLPATGIAYNASGIGVSYQRIGGTASTVTLAAGTGLASEHNDGRWNEIGNGWYQVDMPDAAFASGVDSVLFYGGATGYTFIFESISLVTSQVYPSNFASLGINASGHIARVVLVDTTTTNSDMRGTDSAYTGTPPTAAAIVDEWESQSQADPTGFQVNVKEVNGTSVSGPDDFKATGFSTHSAADVRAEMDSNSTQMAAIVEDTGTTLPSTLTSMTNAITTIDGIVDAILLDTAEIGAAGAGLTEAGGTGDQLTAITGIILDAAGIRSAIGLAAADLDTQLDAIASSAGLDAAGVRAAVGLASANLDTQLGAITADTNELQNDWADGGRLDTLLDTAASGGGASLIVAPVTGSAPRRGTGTAIVTYAGETYTQTISGTDSNGDVIDWTALGTLVFVAEAEDGTDNFTVADGSITQTTTYCQVEIPAAANIAGRKYSWAIRLTTNDEVVLTGSMFVDYAPEVDS